MDIDKIIEEIQKWQKEDCQKRSVVIFLQEDTSHGMTRQAGGISGNENNIKLNIAHALMDHSEFREFVLEMAIKIMAGKIIAAQKKEDKA